MATYILVNNDSADGLLPDGANPLPDPSLTLLTLHDDVMTCYFLLHSPKSNLTRGAHKHNPQHIIIDCTSKATATWSYWPMIYLTVSPGMQVGVCFTELTEGECRSRHPLRMSLKDCCCSEGKGWSEGRICQLCPLPNTGEERNSLVY